ncbi:MAG: tRNA (guanosine(37)-N1)-methyltransferase TrmD [Pseudomonadota bacterium]
MSFDVAAVTLYPDAFPGPLGVSILKRGQDNGLWALETIDLRQFGEGKHLKVDDTPAGGGAGLVLRADIAAAAIDSIDLGGRPVLFPSPRGVPFTQARARELSLGPGAVFLCGRFEGLDQRVLDTRSIEEVSLGDYVLAGGEVAAQAMIEATVRLLPGVAGNDASLVDESFENGLLEYPQYTAPRVWEDKEIPPILLSGNHKAVAEWRLERSQALTRDVRPDLWAAYPNNAPEKAPQVRASETDDECD